MGKISLNELAGMLAEKLNMDRRTTQCFVNAVVTVVQAGIEKDRLVKIKGLGTFKVIDVEARESVNVNTGERLVIEGHSKLAFVPDSAMKELVNKPFSQFETVVLNDGVEFEDMQQEPLAEDESTADEEAVVEEEEMVEEEIIEDEELPVEEEEEHVVEEKPFVEKEALLAKEEVPVVEEKESVAPLVGETPKPADEEPQDDETEETQEDEAEEDVAAEDEPTDEEIEEDSFEPRSGTPWYWWVVVSILALALGFAAGYYVGHDVMKPSAVQTVQEPKAEPVKEQPTQVQKEQEAEPVAEEETTPVAAPQEEAQTAEPAAQTGVPEWERYNDMDARTRNGYYYIMGLDRMEKVREGDNTQRISSRVFGAAEMACYIEVFNGITASTELEPGTEIKIPKVETKKSVKRRLQQEQQNNQ